MINPRRYLVTSALPYANGPLHIGHLAGAYISADIYVRFLRLMGKDVVWVCGSDEHGAAITIIALKEGVDPEQIIDKYHALFEQAFKQMNIAFDIYHRTSAKIHHETSQGFFRTLYEKGEFIEKVTDQYYDEDAQQFLADRYIKGECPKCGHDEAYGDQCENCGSSLSPTELKNPVSTLTGSKPILRSTKHWYLQLDQYEDWLKDWMYTGTVDGKEVHDPNTWKKHVLGQCRSWLDSGLAPRSMTRDLDWGIDVPKEIRGHEGKKLYVWLDAPIGYISATKQWALDNNKDWEPYWQDEETALIHFIGKDNIVFHCLIFPAILKAHGGYILPVNVPANQFVNLEGDKISTSKNWAIWVNKYADTYPNKIDELRYHMIKIMPEQKDSEFTWAGYQESVNNELVNNLANFVNRVAVLTNEYYDGIVPDFNANVSFESPYEDDLAGFHDSELLLLHDNLQQMNQHIREFDFRSAMKVVLEISQKGNQLLQFNEPWKTIKEDQELVKTVMNLALQIVSALSICTRPFLPETSDKLRKQLNLSVDIDRDELNNVLEKLCEGEHLIESGHKIGKAEHLFMRIDDEMIKTEKAKLVKREEGNVQKINGFPQLKETIEFTDFQKLDLRTGTIEIAEKVKKTDKLLKLTVDLGFEKRTVVSGIAEHYKPEDLMGKQVMLVANLAPRKLKGIESQGMILMAEDENGNLNFVSAEGSFPNGMTVR